MAIDWSFKSKAVDCMPMKMDTLSMEGSNGEVRIDVNEEDVWLVNEGDRRRSMLNKKKEDGVCRW